jgi:hypothetical protein
MSNWKSQQDIFSSNVETFEFLLSTLPSAVNILSTVAVNWLSILPNTLNLLSTLLSAVNLLSTFTERFKTKEYLSQHCKASMYIFLML